MLTKTNTHFYTGAHSLECESNVIWVLPRARKGRCVWANKFDDALIKKKIKKIIRSLQIFGTMTNEKNLFSLKTPKQLHLNQKHVPSVREFQRVSLRWTVSLSGEEWHTPEENTGRSFKQQSYFTSLRTSPDGVSFRRCLFLTLLLVDGGDIFSHAGKVRFPTTTLQVSLRGIQLLGP